MRLACLAFAAVLLLAAPALAFDARDRSFAPGRVGAIVIGVTKPADLATIYGADSVKYETMGYEGGTTPGAYIFRDTPDFLQVMFDEEGKKIDSVIIGGRNWVAKSGLRTRITAAQLERLHGGPFKFQGFGADEAGKVYAGGAALKSFIVYIGEKQGSDAVLKHFRHEAVFSSRHPAFKTARFEVTFITVNAVPRE
jgi:hypothetical protein